MKNGVSRIDNNLNELIDEFYEEKVGPYWGKEIKYIENKYRDIEFEFEELQAPKDLQITTKWSKEDLFGHLNTWSSVRIFMNKNDGINPVNELYERIDRLWSNEDYKEVSFPIFMRLGKIQKQA